MARLASTESCWPGQMLANMPRMIEIRPGLVLPEENLTERFVRSSGPGGQNVNKLSTAVELRFDMRACEKLNEQVKIRLARLAGRRLTLEGVIVIFADQFRTQERNRADARERLAELVRQALIAPKKAPKRQARSRLRLGAPAHQHHATRTHHHAHDLHRQQHFAENDPRHQRRHAGHEIDEAGYFRR
jgi:ribosome-associated protein